jgi:hypothetical protein
MNRRTGHVDVTTEVGYCNFCNRTRNLRHEAHHLGALVRTIVSCETCHRTLSSAMGVAGTEPEPEPESVKAAAPAPAEEEKPTPRRAPARRAPAKRTTKAKAAAKPKTPPKPRSTATRKTTRKK